jgi:hypothetical protein
MKSNKKVIDTENIEELKNLLAQKNRELEIEAALERVRTMTMAMHKTEGLIEVIKTVFKQFELLEVKADVCFINIH